ncbi:MAG: hypothetical protein PHI63_03670 [Patescibacteria group bacterium]|nr:hypothetical protein [Patescibacteria group bacterium]
MLFYFFNIFTSPFLEKAMASITKTCVWIIIAQIFFGALGSFIGHGSHIPLCLALLGSLLTVGLMFPHIAREEAVRTQAMRKQSQADVHVDTRA